MEVLDDWVLRSCLGGARDNVAGETAIETTELPMFLQAKSQTRRLIAVDVRIVPEGDQTFQSYDFEYDLDIRGFGIPTNALPHLTPRFSLRSAAAT